MKFTTNRFLWLGCCVLGCGRALAGCVSAPQVLTIPSFSETARPPYGTKDYVSALAAITSVMVRDLNLPPIDGGSLTLYPSQASYEAGVVAESLAEVERLRKLLGPRAKQSEEVDSVLAAKASAVSSSAVGMYKRVLINEWRVAKYSWSQWIRIIAHELTHTTQRELVDGRSAVSDQWVREGFAEWVGYKVVDTFGAQGFGDSRKQALDSIVTAKSYQTFPSLGQLARNRDWVTWSRTLGRAATYGQAFIAVDLLVEEKGVPAMIEYFRLFKKLNNRERNFLTAFGQSVTAFDSRFNSHLQVLLGK